jgi:hypothetical protein
MIHQPMMWLSAGFGLCCALLVCAMLRAQRSAGAAGPLGELIPAMTLRRAGEVVCPAHARAVLVAGA